MCVDADDHHHRMCGCRALARAHMLSRVRRYDVVVKITSGCWSVSCLGVDGGKGVDAGRGIV